MNDHDDVEDNDWEHDDDDADTEVVEDPKATVTTIMCWQLRQKSRHIYSFPRNEIRMKIKL
jgi:hypothetical protein